jgi:hypothetical protein
MKLVTLFRVMCRDIYNAFKTVIKDLQDESFREWLFFGISTSDIEIRQTNQKENPNPTCKCAEITYPRETQFQESNDVKYINTQINVWPKRSIPTRTSLSPDFQNVPNNKGNRQSQQYDDNETNPEILVKKTGNGFPIKKSDNPNGNSADCSNYIAHWLRRIISRLTPQVKRTKCPIIRGYSGSVNKIPKL